MSWRTKMYYNPYGSAITIDSLKGNDLYSSLHQYNLEVFRSCKNFKFGEGYQGKTDAASWWFNPKEVDNHPLSHLYHLPIKTHHVQKDPRFCLPLYAPNYFSLLLINTLYEDRKDVLVEEQAGGQGVLLFYLNKLGFKNFTLIDNWTQLPIELMQSLLYTADIYPHLTPPEKIPEIVNLIGYTYFVKPINPETELVITYNNTALVIKGEGETYMFRDQCLERYSIMQNKVWLATEKHGLANAYCNKDKVEEFTEKLRKFEA